MATETGKDVNGKDSAKRLWGGRYLLVALLMAIAYFLTTISMAVLEKTFSFEFPLEIWYGLVGGGFTALGLTIFESKTK